MKVTGPRAGRYRIGRQFTAEPTTLAVNPEQLEALRADPELTVEVID